MSGPTHDDIARGLVERWVAELSDLFGPAVRASALLTIARVAGELAEKEEAKIPDLWC